MKNWMMTTFLYTTQERARISDRVRRELNDTDWHYLEAIATDFRSTFFQRMLNKKAAGQVEKTARKLYSLLEHVFLAEDVGQLWSPKASAWLSALDEIQTWGKAQPRPKSERKQSNRARPDALDGYLTLLVQRYMKYGGKPGRAPSSPCTKFVVAVASPVLATIYFKELKPSEISNLIRSRIWLLAPSLVTSPPEIGTPRLKMHCF